MSVSEVVQSLERNPELIIPDGTISHAMLGYTARLWLELVVTKFATAQAQQVVLAHDPAQSND
jgi:hypothetical protein